MKIRIGAPLLGLVVLAGCNQSSLVGIPSTRVETRQQAFQDMTPPAVDVLWVIDDSGSMGVEQAMVGNGFEAFAERFEQLGLDFHLGVTSADPRPSAEGGRLVGNPPVMTSATADLRAEFLARAMLGTDGGAREAGLESARLALSEPNLSGPNAGFLRDEAILAIIFVSDEDDQSISPGDPVPNQGDVDDPAWRAANLAPIQELTDFFVGLKDGDPEKVFVASIIGDPVGDPLDLDDTGCGDAEGGFRYADASEAMRGFWRSICGGEDEFRDILDEIALELVPADPLPTTFATDYYPMPGSVSVTVDGVPVPEDTATGWYWAPGVGVVFSAPATPPSCAIVEISYDLPPGVQYPAQTLAAAPGCQE